MIKLSRPYDNNVIGLITLLNVMQKHQVKNLVFSSSSGVYGNPEKTPITEDTPMLPISPYGHTKAMGEQILRDLVYKYPEWRVACLRYFNPIGAHESGVIGEEAFGVPNTLLPYLTRVAAKELSMLRVFGGDYPTIDGTPVRDYLHVMDLAEGHVSALQYIRQMDQPLIALNLGAGQGISVLQMVHAFEKVSKLPIPYEIVERRFGDAAASWANPTLAEQYLGWKAKRNLEQMIEDAWRWQCYSQ
ncbi:MAG: UDP-glucose 4-epimerase GalE [Saezia sp.]